MLCLYCSKEFNPERSTAKYCSENCKLRFNRGSAPLNPVVPVAPKGTPAWQDLYEKCDGCDGKNCASGFVPNSPDSKEFINRMKSSL